jgi:hypothetical protein
LTASQLRILDWFEDREYTRSDVAVQVLADDNSPKQQRVATQVYVWTNALEELDLTQPWDYEGFCRNDLAAYLLHTVQPCRLDVERLGYTDDP